MRFCQLERKSRYYSALCTLSIANTMHHDIFTPVLFGGDQLTAARARGSQQIRVNSERESDRLRRGGLAYICCAAYGECVIYTYLP